MSGNYRKLLVFWGALFTLSMLFIFTSLGPMVFSEAGESDGLDQPNVSPESPNRPEESGFNLGMALAVITAVASGGGFIATTYFAMRADRREAALHQLQIESLKKEIEHKDLEISRLRRERRPPPSAPE